jgi:hypothetical protein
MKIYPPATCSYCGCAELHSEPTFDEEAMPSGLVQVTCMACGRTVAELGPPRPAPEADPSSAEELPSGTEE